jgi:hypothetical protein
VTGVTTPGSASPAATRRVGPVLQAGELGRAIAQAIVEANPSAEIIDRGAYYRVLADGSCTLSRSVVERISGRAFLLPGDLERVMPAFSGYLSINSQAASWTHEAA